MVPASKIVNRFLLAAANAGAAVRAMPLTAPAKRLKYAFDNFMSQGGLSVFMALLFLFLLSFLAMAAVRFVFNVIWPEEKEPLQLFDQLWRVFLQISDAGAVAEDGENHLANKIAGIATIFLGLVLFSSLVAFITSQFEAKLAELRKGKSEVIEQNHTLILGFGDRVLEIIRELIVANESERNAAIVVLSDRDKEEMDDFFRERIEEWKTTRIVTRTGLTSSRRSLEKVGLSQARSVIILNDSPVESAVEEKALADARVLKTIMAVLSCTGEDHLPPVIAEIHTDSKRELARAISPAIYCIEEHSLLAKLIVQTSRTTGLANVYDTLVGFEGSEFYYYRAEQGWSGKKYKDLLLHFPNCSLLGYRTKASQVVLNPDPETVFREDYEALLIAEDDSAIHFTAQSAKANLSGNLPRIKQKKLVEQQLIVGWSRKAPLVVDEYSQYLVRGSAIDVVAAPDALSAREALQELSRRHRSIKIRYLDLDIHDLPAMRSLRPEKYDNVIILKGDGGDPELRDSETIATLLEFRHHFKSLGKKVKTQLISEVADSENIEIIKEAGVQDFLISNKFVSKIYAQASEEPQILKAFEELFSEAGSEIYIKPATLYFASLPAEISFADLVALASLRKETAFGVRIAAEEHQSGSNHGFYINPPKQRRFHLTREDFLIVLAEDES